MPPVTAREVRPGLVVHLDTTLLRSLGGCEIFALERHAQIVGEEITRRCVVCATGVYNYLCNENHIDAQNFGIRGAGAPPKIFACTNCGHVQIFSMAPGG